MVSEEARGPLSSMSVTNVRMNDDLLFPPSHKLNAVHLNSQADIGSDLNSPAVQSWGIANPLWALVFLSVKWGSYKYQLLMADT